MAATKTNESSDTLPLKAVLYADGGSKPSRGFAGWGVHGYTYQDSVPKQGSGCKGGIPTAQGYQRDKSIPAVTVVSYIDAWGAIEGEGTNNIAELTAARKALAILRTLEVTEALVYLDSKYVLEGVTKWVETWQKSGWVRADGEPVANKELWQALLDDLNELYLDKVKVTWQWIKGHDGDVGNELADRAACRGTIAARKGEMVERVEIVPAKGYWNKKVEVNRLFSHSRWYFNTHMGGAVLSEDGRWVYYLGDHGTDDELLGKPISDNSFSVLYLKEPEPVLEMVRAHQDAVDPEQLTMVVTARLDYLFQPETYLNLQKEGSLLLTQRPGRNDLYFCDTIPLTSEIRPPRLAYRAVEGIGSLETTLKEYLKDAAGYGITVTDITDDFYLMDEKSGAVTRLKPDINSSLRSIQVDARYSLGKSEGTIPLILVLGLDTAKRNDLAALAPRQPKVKLLTWRESDHAFRYATVIEVGDDVGIWAGIYSNLRLI